MNYADYSLLSQKMINETRKDIKYYSNITMLCLTWPTNLAHTVTMLKIIFNLIYYEM